jgi:hypothetical protein
MDAVSTVSSPAIELSRAASRRQVDRRSRSEGMIYEDMMKAWVSRQSGSTRQRTQRTRFCYGSEWKLLPRLSFCAFAEVNVRLINLQPVRLAGG